MTTRRLKTREVHLYISFYPKVVLTEVNNLQIDYPQLIGFKEGLTKNFDWYWRTGIVTITIQGNSYIGAFVPEKQFDRVDKDMKLIKQYLQSFREITVNQSREMTLWIFDDSGDTEFYVGKISDFKTTESSEKPFYISYNITFKSTKYNTSLESIKELALLDASQKFFTRQGSIEFEQNIETINKLIEERKITEEEMVVSDVTNPKEIKGVKSKKLEEQQEINPLILQRKL